MKKTKVPFVDLKSQWSFERKSLLKIIDKVMSTGQFVGGKNVDLFEKKIAKLCNVKHAVSMNSGTDALTIALHVAGIGRGDEVITAPNSFISTASIIAHLGAKPVFVDVLPDQNIDPNKVESAISSKTKAIIPVHLTGRISEMKSIMSIAKKNNLVVIEDAAQSIGSKYYNKMSGSIGHIGCFSTHPLKNLNAAGDGGFITTNNTTYAKRIKKLCNLGIVDRNVVDEFGYVSRLDNLQAAILIYRLSELKNVAKKRRENAKFYIQHLNEKYIYFPKENDHQFNTYHTFVIQIDKRDKLQKYLLNKGINTAIHYPIPIHLQPASKSLNYKMGDFPIVEKQSKKILSLPVHQFLSKKEIKYITKTINEFFEK